MATQSPMSREVFLRLAADAGLNADSPHMDELYPYVETILASLRSLHKLDVAGAEPDMAFQPMLQGGEP